MAKSGSSLPPSGGSNPNDPIKKSKKNAFPLHEQNRGPVQKLGSNRSVQGGIRKTNNSKHH